MFFLSARAVRLPSPMQANAGNAAQIQIDPSNPTATELAVNEGGSLQLAPRVIDSAGSQVQNPVLSYASTNSEVATVDTAGIVQGRKAGFATLVVTSEGAVATTTIAVVQVTSGVSGFEITGVAQDLAQRLYLANSREHTILQADDLQQTPLLYAGTRNTAGLVNDERVKSLFNGPAYLAVDQNNGSIYVSDGANHVIRQVRPGPSGSVSTLAGLGQSGSADGPATQSSFREPQGVALDNRGNLWVVDSGNHTLRRISLVTRTVSTVAGRAGSPGDSDGTGDQARFNSPTGIAIESESLAQQLERQSRGEPPPPVTVFVADTGNGLIRRVKEDGKVETIGLNEAKSFSRPGRSRESNASVFTPTRFNLPAGIAADVLGNIYVSEPASNLVRIVLRTGGTVAAAQPGTFSGPRGIAITLSGRVLVAEANRSSRQIRYGEPAVSSISPERARSTGGARIQIRGRNFARDTSIVVTGIPVSEVDIRDTENLSFTLPPLPSGRVTVTVQNRGGLAQTSLLLDPPTLWSLKPGEITTVAGGTTFIGDGSPARSASMAFPKGLDVDQAGNLIIADTDNNRIRKVAALTGVITTIAGTGVYGSFGDGGPATVATLAHPADVALDAAGNIYVADTGNNRIRRIEAKTGVISNFAGNGEVGASGDGGPADKANFFRPEAITFDPSGNLFVSDFGNFKVRRIDAISRVITTLAGTGKAGFDGENVRAAVAQLAQPAGLTTDPDGNLFIADLHRVRKVDAKSLIITTIAGAANEYGSSGDDGPAVAARLNNISDVAMDSAGNLYITDTSNQRIRRVNAGNRTISTFAGTGNSGFGGDEGPALNAQFAFPAALAIDGAGNLFVSDLLNTRIRRISARNPSVITYAGSSPGGSSGDNAPATAAAFTFPAGVAVDADFNLYVVDSQAHKVRKVDLTSGLITTTAGTGQPGPFGDGGPATEATLTQPMDLALDSAGNIYVVDTDSQRIRKIDAKTRIISTVAGVNRLDGFGGDGGKATSALLNFPSGITVDRLGNIFIADTQNHCIRRVDVNTNNISTIAGRGKDPGFSGDGGKAAEARLAAPEGLAMDSSGSLYIADVENRRIRRVDSSGNINTVAGSDLVSNSGDDGPARQARLVFPRGVALDRNGNLYIADYFAVRKVSAGTGIITTVAGTGGYGSSGDGGPAPRAQLDPVRVAADSQGNIYVSDWINHRVRVLRFAPARVRVRP